MKKKMMKYLKDHRIVFLTITTLILFPTWQKGYLFFLDWNVSPFLTFSDIGFWSHSLGRAVLSALAVILPFALYQKLALFLLVFFLGIGGWKLAEIFIPENSLSANFAKYFAGIFMIFNPFIYGRLADGQYGVALGILFILYFIIFAVRFENSRLKKHFFAACLFAGLAVNFTLHAIFFVGLSALVLFSFHAFSKKAYAQNILKFSLIMFFTVFLNINVIAGFIFQKNSAGEIAQNFDQNHLEAFNTGEHETTSVYLNALSLHGYWGEREDRFISTQSRNFIWKPVFLLIFALVLFGAWSHRKNKLVRALAALGLLSFILGIGIRGGLVKTFNQFLYDYVPFYMGLREPQKWIGLLLIAYAGLGALGLKKLLELKDMKEHAPAWGLAALFLVFIYTPTMFAGFLGQLKPIDFPSDWYATKEIIAEREDEGKVLVLPWNQYLDPGFLNGKEVANPARAFFGDSVIQGDNMETSTAFTQSNRPESKVIEKHLFGEEEINSDFLIDLEKIGIGSILLLKNEDLDDYGWLDKLESLELIQDSENLKLYAL